MQQQYIQIARGTVLQGHIHTSACFIVCGKFGICVTCVRARARVCVYTHTHTHIYIYIERERELSLCITNSAECHEYVWGCRSTILHLSSRLKVNIQFLGGNHNLAPTGSGIPVTILCCPGSRMIYLL
jgi:hypothetical protein